MFSWSLIFFSERHFHLISLVSFSPLFLQYCSCYVYTLQFAVAVCISRIILNLWFIIFVLLCFVILIGIPFQRSVFISMVLGNKSECLEYNCVDQPMWQFLLRILIKICSWCWGLGGRVKSAYKPSGPSGRSLSRFP